MKKGSSSQVSDSLQALSHLALEAIQFKGKTGRMYLGRHSGAIRLVPAPSPRHGREASGEAEAPVYERGSDKSLPGFSFTFFPFHSFVFKEILGTIKKRKIKVS